MSSSVHPEPQPLPLPVVAIATGVAITTVNEEVTAAGLLAGQPSSRHVKVRRSALQEPGFELQTYWPMRIVGGDGSNPPRHGRPQVRILLTGERVFEPPWYMARMGCPAPAAELALYGARVPVFSQVVIGRIDPAGAAHFSGLVAGDHLLSINGAAVDDVSSAVGQQGHHMVTTR